MGTRRVICSGLAVAALAWIATQSPVIADTSKSPDIVERPIGSVQIGKTDIGLLIAYRPDGAILHLSIQTDGESTQYLPVIVSTHRGIDAVDVDFYVTHDDAEVWALSSLPGGEILAHYRLGANAGQTAFGPTTLSDTAFPEFISGGPIPYPAFDPQMVSRRATFYHRPDAGRN